MEQKQKNKQKLGSKLSDRDVQFTNAIRKAEIKNSNEVKNMKKSIEQLFKEHQQVMNNLKRERSNLVRRWNLRRQESGLAAIGNTPKDDHAESQNAEERVVKDKEPEVRFPYINAKEQDQKNTQLNYQRQESSRNYTVEKIVKQENDVIVLPPSIDKRSSERSIRDGKHAQFMPQVTDSRFSTHVRKISAMPFNSAKSSRPSKRSLSVSQEPVYSHLIRPQNKFERNLSVDALRESSVVGKLPRSESKDEIKSFFKTDP